MPQHLFEFAPVPLWIEDFSAIRLRLDELEAAGVEDLVAHLQAHPELVAECAGLVRILDVNPAAVALHRAPSREALLAGLDQVFTESSLETFGRELCRLAAGDEVVIDRGEVRTLDGETLDVSVRIGLDPAYPDWSKAYVATLDRTEERRAMDAELALQERLMETQRAESLGALAGGVAHDFNNILMAILGQVELSLERLDLDSPLRADLQAIQGAARRAADLSHQMLAFSGRGHFSVEELDLNELVRTSEAMLRASVSPEVDLGLNLVEPPPRTRADAGQVQQALVNLVANASEALASGRGAVHITTGRVRLSKRELRAGHGLAPDAEPVEGSYAFLEVRDQGAGMSPEILERIFDPFFSTKFVGRGLGLAAVHGIARGHGGVVHVESEPGRGTRVRLALPALEPAAPTPDARTADRGADPRPRSGGRVLVAEDEPPVRRVLVAMLQRLGFETAEAADGVEALEAVARTEVDQATYDAVIVDLSMPRLDGLGVLASLRDSHPRLPVILTSGYDREGISERADAIAGFLAKPYTRTELEAVLDSALGAGT